MKKFIAIVISLGFSLTLNAQDTIIRFDYSADEINAECSQAISDFDKSLDRIGQLKPHEITFTNSALALDHAVAQLFYRLDPPIFLAYTSTTKLIRDTASACETKVNELFVDLYTREDVFKTLKSLSESSCDLTKAQKRLLDDHLVGFKRNGLELDPDARQVLIAKKKELVGLQDNFSKTLTEWTDSEAFSLEELDGLPDDYINRLDQTDDGKYVVTVKYPDYFPFIENAKNADARKRLYLKFARRGGEQNKQRLETAIALRHEIANMLGYTTHAQYVLEQRMAKTPETVEIFLSRLRDNLEPLGQSDIETLLELKQEELNDPSITEVHAWDWRYYENMLKKKRYQIDHQKISEYFPLEVVNKGMFEIYQTLLGVTFEPADSLPTWHEDVLAYQVKKNGKTVSYFYMDLFPRTGKYNHAAAFTLRKGYLKADGSYQKPVSSIVANFNPPAPGKPSLLTHDEVETLFHEFGHIMHQVLTTSEYYTFGGTSVKRDFVEAPSQMLENWVWNKASLGKLSGHYLDHSKPLPEELLNKLTKAKLANVGVRYLRQLFFATLDMTYHTSASVDSTNIYRGLFKDILGIEIPEGVIPQASFGHLMGGYDASYYGYLWSEVYAQDMFTRFESEGLLNSDTGSDYRRWILEPGGSQDPMTLISGFLGRQPNDRAFYRSLGLGD